MSSLRKITSNDFKKKKLSLTEKSFEQKKEEVEK